MPEAERRVSERLTLRIPIHVMGFATAEGDFTEDTETLVINRTGARIALKHHVAADDTLRIVNMESHSEADFRVVVPTRLQGEEVSEWGVECTEKDHNLWGIHMPPVVRKNLIGLECVLEMISYLIPVFPCLLRKSKVASGGFDYRIALP